MFQLTILALAVAFTEAGVVGYAGHGLGYAGHGKLAYAAAPVAVAAPVGVAYAGHGGHDIDYYVNYFFILFYFWKKNLILH